LYSDTVAQHVDNDSTSVESGPISMRFAALRSCRVSPGSRRRSAPLVRRSICWQINAKHRGRTLARSSYWWSY